MRRRLKPLLRGLFFLGLLATPAMAQDEANGYAITEVNLRAGPGTEYPVLVTVPTDSPITILGCLEDYSWCDTIFEDQRGWMRSIYLAGYYDGEYYLLSDYAPDLGYQVVTFDRPAYWDAYYQNEPFYSDRYRVSEARGEDWVDEGVFYDRLAPHGSWTWIRGQYVWVPTSVGAGWRPYTRGRWIYTNYGWTWVSDEPFGWATYHYGRWGFSSRIGWFWVPGNRWGPAWVSWRQSDDYLAWAPLPPAYDRGGLSINISFGDIPSYYWSVVPSLYFLSNDLPQYYVSDRPRWRNAYDRTRPIGHTTIINNTVVNNVVTVNYVERHTNTDIVERKVKRTRDWDRANKIHGEGYEVYRPGLREGRAHRRPEKVREVDEVARLSKTKGLARDAATTEHMLAPPEIREAIKKRRGGRVVGEGIGPREFSRAEPDGSKFKRQLPKGRDAEGPPPATRKAKTDPVPAHDLSRVRRVPAGKDVRETGPRDSAIAPNGAGSLQDRAKAKDQKRPPQARSLQEGPPPGPKGLSKERAKVEDQKKPSQAGSRQPGPSKSQGSSDRNPLEKGPPPQKAKSDGKNGPPQARSRQPGPSKSQSSSDRKPLKKGPPPQKAKSDGKNGPPQAGSRQPGPSKSQSPANREPLKKGPPPQKAKSDAKNGPPQAGSRQPGHSKTQSSSDRKPLKKGPPPQKAKSDAKNGPPQARSRQQGLSKSQSSSDRKPLKKGPPPQKAKSDAKNGPPQARSRQQGLSKSQGPANREPLKKGAPKQKAKSDNKNLPSQARARQQGPSGGGDKRAAIGGKVNSLKKKDNKAKRQ